MNWNYKGVNITIDNDGFFKFQINGETINSQTLANAKQTVDYRLNTYLKFKNKDLSDLLSKLNKREKHFILDALLELEEHRDSNYCEMGINTDFIYDFDINTFR